MITLYFDVHVPAAITTQLRKRGVDVLTAQDDASAELEDSELLTRSITQDIRFKARAEDWQRTGRTFAGLAFGHPLNGSIGQYVRDLELIAKATDPVDWIGQIEHLPLR